MATIIVKYNFSRDDETHIETADFEVCDGLQYAVEDREETFSLGLESEGWEFDEHEVEDWDDDYGDPADFADLDAYAEYVELCEELGEAYRVRCDDIGVIDRAKFQDSYIGCYNSRADYAREVCDDVDVPDYVEVDWDATADNLLTNYSDYDGSGGVYIFADY